MANNVSLQDLTLLADGSYVAAWLPNLISPMHCDTGMRLWSREGYATSTTNLPSSVVVILLPGGTSFLYRDA
jgi:hypothetical protein